MLYPVLLRTIQCGGYNAEVLQEKLDLFFAERKITAEQYQELTGLIVEDDRHEEDQPAEEESAE
jgi:hypothetical protein